MTAERAVLIDVVRAIIVGVVMVMTMMVVMVVMVVMAVMGVVVEVAKDERLRVRVIRVVVLMGIMLVVVGMGIGANMRCLLVVLVMGVLGHMIAPLWRVLFILMPRETNIHKQTIDTNRPLIQTEMGRQTQGFLQDSPHRIPIADETNLRNQEYAVDE